VVLRHSTKRAFSERAVGTSSVYIYVVTVFGMVAFGSKRGTLVVCDARITVGMPYDGLGDGCASQECQ